MTCNPFKVGMVLAQPQSESPEALRSLARHLAEIVSQPLEEASGRPWNFHNLEGVRLVSNERRHGGDFLGEASLRLVEGSFDLIVVLTDVALISRAERIVF